MSLSNLNTKSVQAEKMAELVAENAYLREREQAAIRYVREKINQLLTAMGTLPLKPEELDDETLFSLDPIGILSNTVGQMIGHLNDTNASLALANDEIQAIFDSAGAGILVVDQEMRLQAFNRKSQELFFADDKEVLGRNFREVICDPGLPAEDCIFDLVMARGATVQQIDFVNRNRHFHVIGTPVKNQMQQIIRVVLVYTDITDRMRMEKALREAEERSRSIIDSVQAGIVVIDADKHVVVDANNLALEMSGYQREDLIGTSCRKAICSNQKGICPITDLGQDIDNRECRMMRADGRGVPVLKTATRIMLDGRLHLLESFIDISARKQAEEALRDSEQRFRSLYEQAPLAYQSLDAQGRYLEVNKALLEMLGYEREDLLGRFVGNFMTAESRQLLEERFPQFLTSGAVSGMEFTLLRKDDTPIIVAVNGRVARDAAGNIQQTHCILHNITERKQAEQKIQKLAYYDFLTDLPNRQLLQDRLKQALAQAHRYQRQVGVLFLDLDRFKRINDTLGHVSGDRFLQTIAERLRECTREADTVARLGGDEFVIVLSAVNRIQDVLNIASGILETVSRPIRLGGHEVFCSTSIGIAVYPMDGEDDEILLKNADTAMYAAKDRGRNTYQFFSEEMNHRAMERMTIETHLRRALRNEELLLHYQPQIDLKSGRIMGVEALVRWNHPTRGLVAPNTFIPLAEESGLIIPVGEWVLRTACAQARTWQEAGFPLQRIAVNLSARQFSQEGLVDMIEMILRETELDPDCLELELTESALMTSTSDAIMTLTDLRVRGIHLSIDDFGTGYSSLSYLKDLPIDRIKIAQEFVRDIPQCEDDATIVEAIIAMGRSLRLQVIAEGVENRDQLEFLKERGCHEMQGYYFSRPLPVDSMTDLMQTMPGLDEICLFQGAAGKSLCK